MDLHQLDDSTLLERLAEGDRVALVALYERHARVVFAQISLLVGDRGLSEEILQDTMLAVWRGASTFRDDSRVRTWIIAIARRQARDRLRRRPVDIVDDSRLVEHPSPQPGPEEVAIQRSAVAEVGDAIRSLTLIHREVLGMIFGADLTLAETAEILEIPIGTVKSRLSAARTALAVLLNKKEEPQ